MVSNLNDWTLKEGKRLSCDAETLKSKKMSTLVCDVSTLDLTLRRVAVRGVCMTINIQIYKNMMTEVLNVN